MARFTSREALAKLKREFQLTPTMPTGGISVPPAVALGLCAELDGALAIVEAFEAERKAGRFHCECEWAPDEYTTLVRRCVTHQALDDFNDGTQKAYSANREGE